MSGYKGFNSNGKSASGNASAPTLAEFEIADAYASVIYNGDPVTVSVGAGTLIRGTNSLVPIGVLRGIRYIDAQGQVQRLHYYPASTTNTGTLDFAGGTTGNVVAVVELAQHSLFTIDAATGTNLTQAMIGGTYQLTALNTQVGVSGKSACTVDLATPATVGTHLGGVRIHRIAPIPGNQTIGGDSATLEVSFIESFGDAT